MLRHSMPCPVPDGKLIRNSGLFLSLAFALAFSLAPLAQAQDDAEDGHDSHARIVRISYVEGEVRLDNGHGYESVTMNVPVTEHNWLQTRSDGWAEVQIEDGSLIRVAPDTVMSFTELGRSLSGGANTTIDLDQGEAEFKILKHDGSNFQVTVKNKTVALSSSGFFRVTSTNDDPMEIAVYKGSVGVHDPESGEDVAVKKNETFALNPSDVAQYALDQGTQEDELDQWSKQRDESLRAYAVANHSMQTPYQYGATDLNYYGQYTNVPGYGDVWQPYGVSMDWDPYSNGYWTDSSSGNVWVSSYPWGWMPYRYGRWVFVNGRGWFWAPGGWGQWNSGPRFVNAPPGFHAPAPPTNRRVVDRTPGQPPAHNVGGGGARPGGRGFSNTNDNFDNPDPGRQVKLGRSTHVFTNDEVQTIPPHADAAQPGVTQSGVVNADRRPKTVERQQTDGSGVQQHASDRMQGNRQGLRRQTSNSGQQPPASSPPVALESTPRQPSTPPVREHTAPAQAPAVRQQAAPQQPAFHPSAPPQSSAPMRSQGSSGSSSSTAPGRSQNR